jgi:hypothetical protein
MRSGLEYWNLLKRGNDTMVSFVHKTGYLNHSRQGDFVEPIDESSSCPSTIASFSAAKTDRAINRARS